MDAVPLQSVFSLIWVPLYLFLAGYYLVFHFRDKLKHHLHFAFLWFCWTVYTVGAAGLYRAVTPGEGVFFQRLEMLGAIFAYPTVFLFMRRFYGAPERPGLTAALYVISVIFAIGDLGSELFFTQIPSPRAFTFLGLEFRYLEHQLGWLGVLCFGYGLLLVAITLGLGVLSLYRRRPGAPPLFVGLVIIGLCSVHDSLVGLAIYDAPYLVEHGFVVFAFAAAYFMQDQTLAAQRALVLRTEELQAANVRLKNLDMLKEELLANVSHELRSPLLSVRGYTELLLARKMGGVSPEQASAFQVIARNVNRLLALINTLLDYAKLKEGRVQIERRPVSLAQVVEETIDNLEPSLREKNLRIEWRAPGGPPLTVEGDADKLRQIVDNLLSNAIKASPPDGRVVMTLSSGGGQINLTVMDEGMGIPTDELEQIFERFYQVEPDDGPPRKGSGIGLAVVRELVQLHGGTVQAQNAKGGGACFEVRLPMLTVEHSPIPEPAWPPPAGLTAGRRVLLAEDDRDLSGLLRLALGQVGHAVEVVDNGETALERARQGGFDVILLDLHLPGLSGLDVLRELRPIGTQDHPPVVMMSGESEEGIRERCLEAGCTYFLNKPFSMGELHGLLGRLLPDEQPATPEPAV